MSDSSNLHFHPITPKIIRANASGDSASAATGAGTSNIKKVAWPSLESPGSAGAAPIPLPAEPQVELQKQPDGTSKIIVTCTCGKRLEIICEV